MSSYTDPNGVEITIPTELAERKAWFEGAGAPVKPEGYLRLKSL